MKVVLVLSSFSQSELESCLVLAACVPDPFCPEKEIVRGYYTINTELSIKLFFCNVGQILRFLLWICVLFLKLTYSVKHFNYKSGGKDHKSEVCFGKENFEGESNIAD